MSFLFRKRRSMGAEQGRLQGVPTPAGIQSMDESLQRKFAKGIQFNIKILIRGDRNTGKTCLFHRMQGKPFIESYIPTNEIQVASILWSYRVTNDTVKVEVWDIVDKGRSQKKTGKSLLKMFNEPSSESGHSDMPLDAEFLDVYKGAHGVVFIYDITKQWTWKYIEKELPRVPLHIPIIILGNFRDMGEHRVVARDEALLFVESLERPEGAAPVRYAESSMKNGFGLMHLHKFLSVPFLQLQQETLLQQLQTNREQTLAAKEELDGASKTDDQNYDMFQVKLERIANERRKTELPPQSLSPSSDSSRVERGVEEVPSNPPSEQQRSNSLSKKFSGFLSRNEEATKSEEVHVPNPEFVDRPKAQPTMALEDFVPEGGEVESFLDDSEDSDDEEDSQEDSDDDVDEGNPQVAMDEDLSSPEEEDTPPIKPAPITPEVKKQPKPLKSAKEIVLTESEEESDEPVVAEDEDIDTDQLTSGKPPTEQKKSNIVNHSVPFDQLFEVPQKKPKKTKKKVERTEAAVEVQPSETVLTTGKKSGGLLLEFSPTPPLTSRLEATSPTTESPNIGERRHSKTKKKSKKRKESKETEEMRSETVAVESAPSSDPFAAISSLDAWLNSDSTGKDEQQSSWSTHTVNKINEAQEGDSDEDDEHRVKEKKPKKHKHRKHREGEGEERTARKKKHKSSSRHRTDQDQDRAYEAS